MKKSTKSIKNSPIKHTSKWLIVLVALSWYIAGYVTHNSLTNLVNTRITGRLVDCMQTASLMHCLEQYSEPTGLEKLVIF